MHNIEKGVSEVYINAGTDSCTTDSKEAESGDEEVHLHHEVWFPGITSKTTQKRLTIDDRLQKLYDHINTDQAHLKSKFIQIDGATEKPKLDPYEVPSDEDLSTIRIDLVPDIISKCRLEGRVESDVESDGDTNKKRGMISLQEWKAVHKSLRSKDAKEANANGQ